MGVFISGPALGVSLTTARSVNEVELAGLVNGDEGAVLKHHLLTLVLRGRGVQEVVDGTRPVGEQVKACRTRGAVDEAPSPGIVAMLIGLVRA